MEGRRRRISNRPTFFGEWDGEFASSFVSFWAGERGSLSFLCSRWPFYPTGGAQQPQSLPLGAWRLVGFVVRLPVAAAAYCILRW